MLAPAAGWGWGLVHTAPSCIDQHPGALEYPRKGSRARHGRVAFLEYRKGPGRDSLLVITCRGSIFPRRTRVGSGLPPERVSLA